MFNFYKKLRRTLLAVAAGAMPLATTVDCAVDGRNVDLFIDRYDDDDEFGFFDFVVGGFVDPYYDEEIIFIDECCY